MNDLSLEVGSLINLVLLVLVSAGLVYTIARRISKHQLDVALGYSIGMTYFTVVPLWLLFFYEDLSSLNFVTISSVNWSQNAQAVRRLLMMLLLVTPLLSVFPRTNSVAEAGSGKRPLAFLKLWHIGAMYLVLSGIEFASLGLGGVEAHWADSREAFMHEHGSLGSILIMSSAAFRYAFLFLLITKTPPARYTWSFFLLLAAFSLVDLYTTGTRIAVLQSLLLVFVNILAAKEYRLAFFLICLSLPIAYSMVVFTAVRASMHAWSGKSTMAAVTALVDAISNSNEFHKDKLSSQYMFQRLTESVSINIFVETERIYPEKADFLRGSTLIKPLVFWIPRSIWQNKPYNFPTQIGNRLVGPGVSLNSTAMGEVYANFGELGVFYIPLMLLILRRCFMMLGRIQRTPTFSIALFVLGFTVTRNGIIETALPFAAAIVICSFCRNVRAPASVRKASRAEPYGLSCSSRSVCRV